MSNQTTWFAPPDREICICGIGARTAVGLSSAASAAAIRGGISGIAVHPFLVDKAGEPVNLASDTALPPDLVLHARFEQLLSTALTEASSQPSIRKALALARCVIALPETRPGVDERLQACASATARTALNLPAAAVQFVQRGHAAGLMSMQVAARHLCDGDWEVCLVAGVDSYQDLQTLEWLDANGRLMSTENRSGFPPGEAAGACVLCSRSAAEKYELRVLARLIAASTTRETHTIGSTDVCIGKGLSEALLNVIAVSPLRDEKISATYCDLNGERYRSEEFTYTLLRVQHGFVSCHDYTSPADCWGDVGAASGPLFAVLAVVARQRRYAKGRYVMLWAGSENGDRAAVLMDLN